MDAFRALVNDLTRDFHKASIGHDYSTVVAAHLTAVISVLLDIGDERQLPDEIVELLILSSDLRNELRDRWTRHNAGTRPS